MPLGLGRFDKVKALGNQILCTNIRNTKHENEAQTRKKTRKEKREKTGI